MFSRFLVKVLLYFCTFTKTFRFKQIENGEKTSFTKSKEIFSSKKIQRTFDIFYDQTLV